MGQRLNIEINNNTETLANCYYHWSGYSTTSLEITKKIINYFKMSKIEKNVEGAVDLLRSTGAGISLSEINKEENKGAFNDIEPDDCISRNSGLISISKSGIKETRFWEGGRISLNIEEETFRFECAWKNNIKDDEEIFDLVEHLFYKINDIGCYYAIPFSKVDELLSGIIKSQEKFSGRFTIDYQAFNSIY